MNDMHMKRILFLAVLLCWGAAVLGQTTAGDYKGRYDRLTAQVGASGLGVETLLKKWEHDFPDDPDLMMAKFSFFLDKSQTTYIDTLRQAKYLGNAPVLTLKDSLGTSLNYFQMTRFDDDLFRQASEAAEAAITSAPDRLDFRLYRISALIGYEKDSPDMAKADIKKLIDYHFTSHPKWEYPGLEVDDELFSASIQEYCVAFFKMGTPGTYAAFKEISEKMLSYKSDDLLFLTNLGSYQLVVQHDSKAALKTYNKVLKKDPDNYSAIKNCVLLARDSKNVKLEKKYLPALIRVTPDDTERASAQVRLESL